MDSQQISQNHGGLSGRLAWAFYDWADSRFAAIISTFVFPAYFARQVVGNETDGTAIRWAPRACW